jgi:thiamine-monophosphate kinase
LALIPKPANVAELAFIEALRAIAIHPAARDLQDDVAVLEIGGTKLILTHDALVEGVHFLPDDPPESVAWKLLAVNVSDLAAKGARPLGALMGYTLRGDEAWDVAFVKGLGEAAVHFGVPLLGGDTVRGKERHLSLTVIGEAIGRVPSRGGAQPGDVVYVSGIIGDSGAGLRCRTGQLPPNEVLEGVYLRPQPNLTLGQLLADRVTAMMDVSDGLIIDASRLAQASDACLAIDLDSIPLSIDYRATCGDGLESRLEAATAGDDYVLLFTANLPLPPLPADVQVTRIGQVTRGAGLVLKHRGNEVPLPRRTGWLHR